MGTSVHFETPENVTVAYRLAGPGTRYIAFFIDMLIVALTYAVLLVATLSAIALFGIGGLGQAIGEAAVNVLLATLTILFGFLYIVYFIAFDLLMNGQTPGKRALQCRVVMHHGFSLNAGAIAIREIFRIIDTFPFLWIVPLANARCQRFGDMVAGTIVVSEEPPRLSPLRDLLGARPAAESIFSFPEASLAALRPAELEALELFLERRPALHPEHRESLLARLSASLSPRFKADPPIDTNTRERYLEDLLAAYYRREARHLG